MRYGFVLALVLGTGAAMAQEVSVPDGMQMRQLSTHMGEMYAEISDESASAGGFLETVRFEPWQMIDEMFTRSDVVYLMRHGPTDWSKLDDKGVASTDCDNQRVMGPEGAAAMENLGLLLGSNGVWPGQIVVSEWCRNQQTVENLKAGFARADNARTAALPVETDADLNLLLSLQGAPDVVGMRERITNWDGGDGSGPLLMISHFTNIEELTNFTVFEGEILVLDPKRDNRVLGYVRLTSAEPDVGHFSPQ
ncbi:hypothetical protein [Actibacterium sp. 188UL27-1]|uniref:hypothetical protein n=1 Tax=Actibacterium sp. 188UL27-1 TaxID=2786961 RepID=UPI0019574EDA|nr:hypothetical protein [Actibacterium sp. 188UL27-1]MBM7066899.1 hypothetical protein [Actibacterium sp. 188UL27-1]